MTENHSDKSEIVFTNQVSKALDDMASRLCAASVFVLVDDVVASCVLPFLQAESTTISDADGIITVRSGEQYKNIDTLASIWTQLGNLGATRDSLLINVGGGVITDMGAFAAATFKRGIRFINVPTTLLASVDASVGGKTGINFNSLKNEVGVIRRADGVIISTAFLRTLTSQELMSGYAEMVKHGFITSEETTNRLMTYDITQYDPSTLLELLQESVEIKRNIVKQDLNDHGIRKSLNLGHTAAHAFEALALQRSAPLAHGYAVAFGLLVALILSRVKFDFPSQHLHQYAKFVQSNYGAFEFSCDDYPMLLSFMHHDKKNYSTSEVSYVLLRDYGKVEIDVPISDADITAALDIYRDLLHLP